MCIFKKPKVPSTPILANQSSQEESAAADAEALLRRRRGGAANAVLTSARGIPSTRQLGAPA
ncbi:hypothetical protein [Roseovarius indicus]|jgi:hypothetical protein|uniref:Uncharacterized protein n=1 Tax=Roseovarius indicus TaxID=540747 RepID=A0A0T5P3S0_9RHOB|nr:hypothetical protein [Roseovarius indicus]KRS15652.1 hypothetical protein XM52_22700 [Roseovarius indicus]QEW27838.1 hypothetical protein RIdsm_03659 [Roseovarius indicus]SFE79486.1 hypothetical protein SAMN04488031_12228 [Roseovarius indicus]